MSEYSALVGKHSPAQVLIYKDVLADDKGLATSDA